MLRLSIVIPALGAHAALEEGLVSVLEHRPPASEVLVVFNSQYADPYRLCDEIRFIDVAPGTGPLDCLATGCREARGEIVHLLAAGLEVRAGWAEQALVPFADPAVASVAPLLAEAASENGRTVAGWGYHRGGRAYPVADGSESVGPTRLAGFFRREALKSLPELAALGVGDDLALVALALRLQAAGYRTSLAAESRIVVPSGLLEAEYGFRDGLHQECLFWRSAGLTGWVGSLAAHAMLVAGELPRPQTWASLAGRAVAMTALLGLGRRNDLLVEPAAEPAPVQADTACLRMDARHDVKTPAPAPSVSRSRRSA